MGTRYNNQIMHNTKVKIVVSSPWDLIPFKSVGRKCIVIQEE
jgi:hypothetical protein